MVSARHGVMRRLASDSAGAIAVVVALLAVVLFGMAAFAVDLGLAYNRQRQMQTAADGSALAAAKEFERVAASGVSCAAVLGGGQQVARAQAIAYQTASAPPGSSLAGGSPPAGWTGDGGVAFRCNQNGNIEVQITNVGKSPLFFGALLASGDYQLGARAIAAMGPPNAVTGLRPFAVCSAAADLLIAGAESNPGVNQLVSFDKVFNASAPAGAAPCGTASGNWGTLDFNGGSNPAQEITLWTDVGYNQQIDLGDDFTITFPGQPGFPSANSGNCSTSDGCQSSVDLGNALNNILGRDVVLPVFRTVVGSGGNATYTVTGFLGVKICGWKLGSASGTVPNSPFGGPACYQTSPAQIQLPTTNGSGDNAFQVAVSRFIPVGDISSICGLAGSPVVCNTNLRVTELVQ